MPSRRLSARTETRTDDALLEATRRFWLPAILLAAILPATRLSPLEVEQRVVVERFALSALLLVITLAGSRFAGLWLRGVDVAEGGPSELGLTQAEVADALREPVSQIVHVVETALEQCQPEIAADIIEQGITMTGGGALLRNIDRVLADETGLPVRVAEAPLQCVAFGAGRALEDPEFRDALCPA